MPSTVGPLPPNVSEELSRTPIVRALLAQLCLHLVPVQLLPEDFVRAFDEVVFRFSADEFPSAHVPSAPLDGLCVRDN